MAREPRFESLSVHQQLALMQWLGQRFGDLTGWSARERNRVIRGAFKESSALVEQTHRANWRRLRWAFGNSLSDYPFKPRFVDGPGESAEDLVSHLFSIDHSLPDLNVIGLVRAKPIGHPLFMRSQVVYAEAVRTGARAFSVCVPLSMYWIQDDHVVAIGWGPAIREESVIYCEGGAIVAIEYFVDMLPEPVKWHLPNSHAAAALELGQSSWTTSLKPDPHDVDHGDGQPLRDLPAMLMIHGYEGDHFIDAPGYNVGLAFHERYRKSRAIIEELMR